EAINQTKNLEYKHFRRKVGINKTTGTRYASKRAGAVNDKRAHSRMGTITVLISKREVKGDDE
ncbi:MAG: hypothetical protein ACE5OO_07385, partial [Candidatus Bathyarchaeia archaeon]